MIRGVVGFSHIEGRYIGYMICVRGKRTLHVPLPLFMYHIMVKLWKRKNILGKILFKESTKDFQSIVG